MEKARILIAEDEKPQRELLEGFLKKEGFEVEAVSNGREALLKLKDQMYDIAVLDYKMPDLDGFHTLKEIRRLYPDLPVVMMTAYGTVETAVASMKEGALDYLTKPIDLEELLLKFQKVLERSTLIQENRTLKEKLQERLPFHHIVYGSPEMEEVMGLVARVAQSQATVLIRGESGTGKELIANAIHYASPRSSNPIVKVNCSAIPETSSRANFSAMKRAPSQVQSREESVDSKRRRAEPSFSMRSGISPLQYRLSFSGSFRRRNSSGWDRTSP